jgi:hypothetical protein
VIDVSNPALPVERGSLDSIGRARDVEVVGGIAFVVTEIPYQVGSGGLRVIDVSNPAAPFELARLDDLGFARDVEVVDGIAYMLASGLRTIDVSDPAAPVELIRLTSAELHSGRDVEVADGFAYVAGRTSVLAIDVRDTDAPVVAGAFQPPGHPNGVEVANGLVYVSAGLTGLRVIDFGPEYRRTLLIDIDIDIRPGSDINTINPASRGVVAVAILGSEDFDVGDIDVTTLAFGPFYAPPEHAVGGQHKDVNADGFPDLLAHFRTEETGIEFGDTAACLSGETLDGQLFEGCDAIQTVPH